ncbi:AMP deaminase, partial [Cladochytrium tenue]
NQTGISSIYPSSVVDDFVFNPCGYSLNGLMGRHYYTIHVTPEDVCSYASFETSIPVKTLLHRERRSDVDHETVCDVVQKVVDCFRPGRFSVTLFTHRVHRFNVGDELNGVEAGGASELRGRQGGAGSSSVGGHALAHGSMLHRPHHHHRSTSGPLPRQLHGIRGFRHADHIGHVLGDWDLEFAHYVRAVPAKLRSKAAAGASAAAMEAAGPSSSN